MLKKFLVAIVAALSIGACADKAPPVPVAPPSYMVFFDLGSDRISEQSQNTVAQAAQAFKSRANTRLTVTGYADTVGSPAANQVLSQRRADKVRNDLIASGVPASAITAIGAGEDGLLVPTGQEQKEPRNRRAYIVFSN